MTFYKIDTKAAPAGRETSPFRGRLLVGGLRGSAGKTVVTLGLIGAWKKAGVPVMAFKKGPDYIDAAWHSMATGQPCYCLDVYMMGEEKVARQFHEKCPRRGVAVIEGNRGLFDGFDSKGSYSTAELAKLVGAPVLLVVDATKRTRTAAALVLGCLRMDPDLNIGGVVLNRVSGERHRMVATEAIEEICGVPVLGAIPRLKGVTARERHLGLVTPEETPDAEKWIAAMAGEVEPYLDMERITRLCADGAGRPAFDAAVSAVECKAEFPARIGVVRDSAFPFYYPENLEALERAGAELVWIRAVSDPELPPIDALYLGGGFPETHADRLSDNRRFRRSLRAAVDSGLPVYAECGGAVYLGRRLRYQGKWREMAGVLDLDFDFCPRPQGHGYTDWLIEKDNPFYEVGARVRGHEFHYTKAVGFDPVGVDSVAQVIRGVGFGGSREGVRVNNVVAFYGHVHALGSPEWVKGMIRAAEAHAMSRKVMRTIGI